MSEVLSELPMTLGHPVVMTQSQGSGQEANELVHLRLEVLPAAEELPDEDVTRGISLLNELGHHTIHGLVVVTLEIILSLASLEPLKFILELCENIFLVCFCF